MNKRRFALGLVLCLTLLAVVTRCSRQLQPIVEAREKGVELTVYNQNLALVKDRRTLTLRRGLNEVRFSGVAAQIDPTSVHFRSLTDPEGTMVQEQDYEYDTASTEKLLQKYVDQEISLVTKDGAAYSGTLLSGAGDIILRTTAGEITVVKLDQVQEFTFPRLPEGLITRPTLVWQLESAKAGDQQTEVTYLTNGINWHADYIVLAAEDDRSMDLTGWVTIDNRSGATYEDAKLKLIAGEVQRVTEPAVAKEFMLEAVPRAAGAPAFEEKPFFEYHLYTLQRPTTIKDNQTKQIEFVRANDVPLEKVFVYDGAYRRFRGYYATPLTEPTYGTPTNTKVFVMLEFTNSVTNNLGIPLPEGTVRVYKEDSDGGTEFIGEDRIDHTPKDELMRLHVGNAFDLVGERKQTDFKKLGERALEESFEIKVRNHKAEAVLVCVVEHLFRWSEWEIVRASHDYEKTDAGTIEFRVRVPRDGEVTVTYTVQYQW